MIQVSDNVNYYQGTTTAPLGTAYWGQPRPNTCPGCGRCKDCGRPYEATPYNPWPGYPSPYIGDPIWPYGGPFYTSTGNLS